MINGGIPRSSTIILDLYYEQQKFFPIVALQL